MKFMQLQDLMLKFWHHQVPLETQGPYGANSFFVTNPTRELLGITEKLLLCWFMLVGFDPIKERGLIKAVKLYCKSSLRRVVVKETGLFYAELFSELLKAKAVKSFL
jgi:hypothetical protein